MKTKVSTFAILSIVAACLAVAQPADAEGGNARFKFAANYWSTEKPRIPSSHMPAPAHSVRPGSMPQGASFLGLDPSVLAKPAPPPAPVVPQIKVAARPSFGQATPQVTTSNTPFNAAFGKPAEAAPPLVASAPVATPPVGQIAAPQSLKPVPQAVSKQSARRPVATRSTKQVSGIVRPRKAPAQPTGALANQGSGIDSYGKNFGYVPGPYLPAATGSGTTAHANVYGRLIGKRN